MRSLHAAANRLKTFVLASSEPNMISKFSLKKEGKGKRGRREERSDYRCV